MECGKWQAYSKQKKWVDSRKSMQQRCLLLIQFSSCEYRNTRHFFSSFSAGNHASQNRVRYLYIYQLPQWRQNDGTLQLAAINSVEHFPQFVEMLLLCRHNLQHHRLEILLIWIIWWSRPTTKFLTHKTSFTMNTKAEEHYLCEIPQKCHKLR